MMAKQRLWAGEHRCTVCKACRSVWGIKLYTCLMHPRHFHKGAPKGGWKKGPWCQHLAGLHSVGAWRTPWWAVQGSSEQCPEVLVSVLPHYALCQPVDVTQILGHARSVPRSGSTTSSVPPSESLIFGEVKREKSILSFQLEMKRKANIKYNCWDFPNLPSFSTRNVLLSYLDFPFVS